MAGPWHRATEISENIIYDEIGREVANTGGSNLTTDQEKADHARLIATAPDMLAALKRSVALLREHAQPIGPQHAWWDDIQDAEAVIAKAESRHVTD